MKSTRRSFLALVLVAALACTTTACNTTWITEAEQIAQVAIPAVTAIIQLIAAFSNITPAEQAEVTSVLQQAQNSITLANSLLQTYQTALANNDALGEQDALAKINAALEDAKTNLSAILPALHITDQATVQKITAVVNLVIGQVTAWESLLPVVQTNASAQYRTLINPTRPMHASEFKHAFNKTLKAKTGNPVVDSAVATVAVIK